MGKKSSSYLFLSFPRWSQFTKAIEDGEISFEEMGYSCQFQQFLRVTNRFRAACGLESSNFHRTINELTARGYHELILHFMMYSCLERYMIDCCGYQPNDWHNKRMRWSVAELGEIQKFIVESDKDGEVFNFLIGELKSEIEVDRNKSEAAIRYLTRFYSGTDFNNWYVLSRALRNFFVHGDLTANPGKVKAETLIPIVRALSIHIRDTIRNDFNARLSPLID